MRGHPEALRIDPGPAGKSPPPAAACRSRVGRLSLGTRVHAHTPGRHRRGKPVVQGVGAPQARPRRRPRGGAGPGPGGGALRRGPERGAVTPFRDLARAGLWLGLYVLLALYPLLWLAAAPAPYGGDFRQELASALGFLALSSMAMQFVLTARFHWLAPPFGTDMVYAFHRHLTAVALAL